MAAKLLLLSLRNSLGIAASAHVESVLPIKLFVSLGMLFQFNVKVCRSLSSWWLEYRHYFWYQMFANFWFLRLVFEGWLIRDDFWLLFIKSRRSNPYLYVICKWLSKVLFYLTSAFLFSYMKLNRIWWIRALNRLMDWLILVYKLKFWYTFYLMFFIILNWLSLHFWYKNMVYLAPFWILISFFSIWKHLIERLLLYNLS